jgi:DNA invertase Pin-like site-specific DNA recombinase
MDFGYARVSTREQDLTGQVAELRDAPRYFRRRRAVRAATGPSSPG